MWLQIGNVLVEAKITGRNINLHREPCANFSSHAWPLQIHDIPKTLATLKNLQKSSCQHFSLLLLVHGSFCPLGDLHAQKKKGWGFTFGQDVSGVEIKISCLPSL